MVGTAKTGFIPYVIDVNTCIYCLEPRDVCNDFCRTF